MDLEAISRDLVKQAEPTGEFVEVIHTSVENVWVILVRKLDGTYATITLEATKEGSALWN